MMRRGFGQEHWVKIEKISAINTELEAHREERCATTPMVWSVLCLEEGTELMALEGPPGQDEIDAVGILFKLQENT